MIQLKFNELQWIMDKEGGLGPISPLYREKFSLEGNEEASLTRKGILANGEIKREYYKDIIPLLDPDEVARVSYESPTHIYNISTLSQGSIKRLALRDFEGITIKPYEDLPVLLAEMGTNLLYPGPEMLGNIIKLDYFDFLCYLAALDIVRKNLLLVTVGKDLEDFKLIPLTAAKLVEKLTQPVEDRDVISQMVELAYPKAKRSLPEDLSAEVEIVMEKLVDFGILEMNNGDYIPSLAMEDYADCFAILNSVIHGEYASIKDGKATISNFLAFKGRYGNMGILENDGRLVMMGLSGTDILTMIMDFLNLDPTGNGPSQADQEAARRENEKIRKQRREKMAKMTEQGEAQSQAQGRPRSSGQEPAQKFCSKCGKPYKPGTKFCSKCGNQLG
ncbi:MAG: zinc ribbon domain-containing protein [Bacillota bacterium]|nr:zinc ribbon domain-containing protein [Bacillota bacterium]